MKGLALHLGMFAKYWEAGCVKTRLAATIGATPAATVYRAFVRCLLERMSCLRASRELVVTPGSRRAAFEALVGSPAHWQVVDQGPGDLGTRMERYFRRALQPGRAVVLIGSDSPDLPRDRIRMAHERLADVDVVLGPSEDGGYYLIGMHGVVAPIFDGIAWGSDQVLRQTVSCLERQGVTYSVLPPWYDVDIWGDLVRLANTLDQETTDGPYLALREVLEPVLSAFHEGEH